MFLDYMREYLDKRLTKTYKTDSFSFLGVGNVHEFENHIDNILGWARKSASLPELEDFLVSIKHINSLWQKTFDILYNENDTIKTISHEKAYLYAKFKQCHYAYEEYYFNHILDMGEHLNILRLKEMNKLWDEDHTYDNDH